MLQENWKVKVKTEPLQNLQEQWHWHFSKLDILDRKYDFASFLCYIQAVNK